MRHPAHDPADEKRGDHGRGGNRAPRARGVGDLVEIEARRYRLGCDRVVACTNGVGLRPPVGDARRMLRMGAKPRLDGVPAVGRNLAVDIGVKLVLGHG